LTRLTQEPPRSGRKAFKRTGVSVRERVTSLSIVGLLVAIGVAVWIAGRNFDPGLYSPRTEALKSTGAPAVKMPESQGERASRPFGDSPTYRNPAARTGGTPMPPAQAPASEPAEGYEPAPAPAAKNQPIEIPGATPMGDTEFYSADNLYEKINGRAPAYLEFGFQQLRSRSFAGTADKRSYVDVYEYRMDSPLNAFGIFALERDPEGRPLGFAPDGYSGEMGYFFRQGNCYVQVIASDQKPATLDLAKSVAGQLAKSIPADDSGLGARRNLPAQGMVPGSLAYTQDNAQGQAFLKDVFQADYDFEGKKITFFLMVTTPEAAAKAWESYLAFSGRYGGNAEALPDFSGAKFFQATNFGKSKIIYRRGGELGGVIDTQDPVAARAFLDNVLEHKLR
jgi:hypothetical protein